MWRGLKKKFKAQKIKRKESGKGTKKYDQEVRSRNGNLADLPINFHRAQFNVLHYLQRTINLVGALVNNDQIGESKTQFG